MYLKSGHSYEYSNSDENVSVIFNDINNNRLGIFSG